MGIIDYTHGLKSKAFPEGITEEEKVDLVRKIVYEEKCYSPSAVQRRINIRYSEAKKIVDMIQRQDGTDEYNIT